MGGGLLGGALALALVASVGRGSSGRFTVNVAVEAPVVHALTTSPLPPPVATPFADLGPCPVPFAAVPPGVLTQPTPERDPYQHGVATSPVDSRLVATWTQDHVFVSRDGGGSWTRILDGDGAVLDVSFDCHGRVLVVRAWAGLGVRDGTHERWSPIAGLALTGPVQDDYDLESDYYPPQLIGGGRAIAVIGAAVGRKRSHPQRVTISDDGGVTWRRIALHPYGGLRARGEWTADTLRVAVPWLDERTQHQGIELVTVAPTGVTTTRVAGAAPVALAGPALLAQGWACYQEGDLGGLCVWRAGTWTFIPNPAGPGSAYNYNLVDGPVDVLKYEDEVYPVGPGGFGAPRPWNHMEWDLRTTDLAGRIWGIDLSAGHNGWLIRR